MPKSKRNKIIPLTKSTKKGREGKENLIEDIRNAVEEFQYVYLFTVLNSKNQAFKNIRAEWKARDSRFFFGKNKVMSIALGRNEQEEIKPDIHKLSNCITGFCGLFMTNEDKEQVLKWFSEYSEISHPRSGFVATESFKLEAGPLPQFSHAIEPHLRKLGLPVELKMGVVTLTKDHVVCEEEQTLSPEQCDLLKLFDVKMSEFKIEMKCYWHNDVFNNIAEE